MSPKLLFVLIVGIALIYYIGREVLGSFRHPDDEDLVDYWNGSLQAEDRAAFRQVSEHLASCADCRDRLDEIRKTHKGQGFDAPMIERKY